MKRPWVRKQASQPRRRLNAEQAVAKEQAERRGKQLFRRNRTLVGSSSLDIRSAGELRGDLRSSRTHVHHLTAHRRMLSTIFIAVVAAACLLTWLLYEFTAEVEVSATDGISINEKRYRKAINDYFAAHPFERLRFALNDDELTEYLSHTVPEVVGVHDNGSAGFATSQFVLAFRQPVASWRIGSTQYYVDNSGVPFQTNYFDKPTVKIVDQSGIPESAGTTVASSRFLRFVGRVVTLAQENGLVVTQAIIPAGTTHQVEVVATGHAYPVKLSLDRPVGEQVEDMQRAISYLDAHHVQPAYIDVRVSGKAYYK